MKILSGIRNFLLGNKFRLLLLLSITTVTVYVISSVFNLTNKPQTQDIVQNNNTDNSSAFAPIISTAADDSDEDVNANTPQEYNTNKWDFPDDILTINEMYAPNSNYFENDWTWENRMIVVNVDSVYRETKKLDINILRPSSDIFFKYGVINVGVMCNNKNTLLLSQKNNEFIQGDFDIFEMITESDLLMTYCKNEECNEVGGSCYLVRR